ncbi:DUF6036 family nucleotidyltransferase [Ramlibacter rhizophilus]|uniref:DUF6036 domain-containing protein n=1 Tax=Ramlibacter rhizophilus TaxID=1781167 RepID=A0A4Z0BHB8_9BURK|nr:DUF6036 family nucleotidyltransferase [Ramlibacter rhizophilus]TFY98692.1 hypothetical protein EZ242_14325 [Ramlibacter rhizophilus]
MNVDSLFNLLTEAHRLCGHTRYVIIGSLSVLGMSEVTAIPRDMTMSIDADCYTQLDPGRVHDLQPALGEGSPFHKAHGIYLDPVSPKLPTLPDRWETRLIEMERRKVVALFLEPHDAAVSKLARGEERDVRWVFAGAKANILSLPTVAIRMRATRFLDDVEKGVADALLKKVRNELARASA